MWCSDIQVGLKPTVGKIIGEVFILTSVYFKKGISRRKFALQGVNMVCIQTMLDKTSI